MSGKENKIVLNKLFKLELPKGELSHEGVDQIMKLLQQHGLEMPGFDFDWKWCTENGTLPKRLAKWAYKDMGKRKLEDALMAQIGDIAKKSATGEEIALIDFTNRIDWSPGDFGDSPSCFFGGRLTALNMIEENGGIALRLWRELKPKEEAMYPLSYKGVTGAGRAWVATLSKEDEDALRLVFNGYGTGRETLYFAKLLAFYLGHSYQKVTAHNSPDEENLYMNNGQAFLVGSLPTIKAALKVYGDSPKVDLKWARAKSTVRPRLCCTCAKEIGTKAVEIGGKRYVCDNPKCLKSCSKCGRKSSARLVQEVEAEYYCPDCKAKCFSTCSSCQELFKVETLKTFVDTEAKVCQGCTPKYGACDSCGNLVYNPANLANVPSYKGRWCRSCQKYVEFDKTWNELRKFMQQ